jgi:hypothetical protein
VNVNVSLDFIHTYSYLGDTSRRSQWRMENGEWRITSALWLVDPTPVARFNYGFVDTQLTNR